MGEYDRCAGGVNFKTVGVGCTEGEWFELFGEMHVLVSSWYPFELTVGLKKNTSNPTPSYLAKF